MTARVIASRNKREGFYFGTTTVDDDGYCRPRHHCRGGRIKLTQYMRKLAKAREVHAYWEKEGI